MNVFTSTIVLKPEVSGSRISVNVFRTDDKWTHSKERKLTLQISKLFDVQVLDHPTVRQWDAHDGFGVLGIWGRWRSGSDSEDLFICLSGSRDQIITECQHQCPSLGMTSPTLVNMN